MARQSKNVSKKKPASKKSAKKPASKWFTWFWRLLFVGFLGLSVWLVYLDAQLRSQFDGNKWALPAKVYARPLMLYPGLLITPQQLQAELKWNDYQPVSHVLNPGTYGREGDDWIIYRRSFSFYDRTEAAVRIRLSFKYDRIAEVQVDGINQPLARIEPQYIGGIFPAHHEDRDLIALKDVPPALVAALVAVEDRAFFEHYGISVRGILRALKANIAAGRTVQGGSTLTQQLVKNFFLTNERSLSRKIREAFMALLLEFHYSKEEILEAYLNEVYVGQSGRRSIHGIALASRFYFAKNVEQLQLEEIALLVGMIKGPSYYNPFRNPERAEQRRNVVLAVMQELNIISEAQRIRAQGMPVKVSASGRAGQREYPAFIELVKQQLQQDYRLEDLQNEGLRIYTTLDPWLQHAAEQSIQSHLTQLESRYGYKKPVFESAAVISSVDGAEVRALVGSRKVQFFGFNRALQAKRSIGSLAKPAVYLTALNSGRYDWASIIEDKPVKVAGQDGSLWQPRNYDKKDHGPVFMADALALSLNQATARLGMKVGLGRVADTFEKLGAGSVPPYPSILLGAIAMTPLQVSQMFQTYASGGFYMEPRAIQSVTTADGQILTSYALQSQQVFSPQQIENLRYGMQQVVVKGTARRLARTFDTHDIAAKTGTSNDQRDAWFAGFDNRHLGVIWVGRDDNEATRLTGASGALPIWENIFRRVGVEPLAPLAELQWAWVNRNGQVVDEDCDAVRRLPLLPQRLQQQRISCDDASDNGMAVDADRDLDNSDKESSGSSWLDWLF
jgi:penicillin-binding protein 1B